MQQTLPRSAVRSGQRRLAPLLAAVALLLGVIVAVGSGSVAIGPGEVLRAIGRGLTGDLQNTADIIVWQVRLPRVLLAALVGAALSVAGTAFQGVFRNPLADPYLLGVASGAAFGAAVTLTFAASVPLLARLGVPLVAFVGALLTVALVIALARRGRALPILPLILAGVVLGSSLSAATSFVMLLARERAANVLAWLLGSFGLASWAQVWQVFPLVLLALVVVLLSARGLNVLQLGDEQAAQLGLPVERFKLLLIVVASLATAAAVSVAGVIGFVGLMVPHAARLAFGPDHRLLTPIAALFGALFLVLADLLARTVIAPAELPVGVITALVGAPVFYWLLRRQRRFA